MIQKGDSVKYKGQNEFYPVDSIIADRYLDRKSMYMVTWTGDKDIKLAGVPIPMVSVLFEKVEVE